MQVMTGCGGSGWNPAVAARTQLAAFSAVILLIATGPRCLSADLGGLALAWTNNMLTVSGPDVPGGRLEIWYLEAFCRGDAHDREWNRTTIPHSTELVSADSSGRRLQLRTRVQPQVEVLHDIRAGGDEVEFRLTLKNHGGQPSDVQWFQPCIRVDRFTGGNQTNYIAKSFIFTDRGLTTLDQTRRTESALYRGGQVYVPPGIDPADVNPRPISPDQPVHALIGCISADERHLLASAWDHPHELFQGVIVCLHCDPHVGGLKPGETKKLHGRVYLLPNDPDALLKRYRRDFPH